jgi:hypothetical protein
MGTKNASQGESEENGYEFLFSRDVILGLGPDGT